jgi:hypothetical protein
MDMNEESITIDLRLFDRGNLKAFADITIPSMLGEITVRGFRVIQKDGKVPWVGFPAISYIKNGKTVNNPILEVPKKLQLQIAKQVLAEFQRASGVSLTASSRP